MRSKLRLTASSALDKPLSRLMLRVFSRYRIISFESPTLVPSSSTMYGSLPYGEFVSSSARFSGWYLNSIPAIFMKNTAFVT